MDNLKNMTKRIIIVALIAIAIFSVAGLYSLYTDYLEIKEIGEQYVSVFLKDMFVKVASFGISFLVVFIFACVNILIFRKVMLGIDVSFEGMKKLSPFLLLSLVIAFLGSGYIKEEIYSQYLMYTNSVSTGISDPVFGKDISYYVFQRPFLKSVADIIVAVEACLTFLLATAYLILYSKLGSFSLKETFKQKGISGHILSNIAVILLVFAFSFRFRAKGILYSSFGGLSGAGYTDVNIWAVFYKFAPFIILICAVSAIYFVYKCRLKGTVISFAVYPVLLLLVTGIGAFTQYFIVTPSEVSTESEYIGHNIEFTKFAYGLDKIKEKEFEASNSVTPEIIAEQSETLNNIRIIDYDATQIIASQLQSLRNYYEFKDLDISVMNIDGKKRPIATMVREIKKDEKSATTNNYINDKLRFTHGYGLVNMPINEVSVEGQPIFYSKDIPMKFENGVKEVSEPRIYYGEYNDDYSVVNTTIKEFDYLDGEENIETVYTGESGIKLNGLNRFIYAIKEKDYQLLVSKFITKDSKLLINKNVVKRAQKAVPFLKLDDDPYSIIDSEGRIKWVLDAFTTTDAIPYSQKYEGLNYIRNSAKVVIDAYDGTVKVYITDESDMLIKAYEKIYPQAFEKGELPEDIKYSVKYCESLFKIQAEMLKRYHVSDATTFYNKSDVWDIAYEMKEERTKLPVEPYYNMMKLDESDEAGLVLMLPFTISQKDNMVSWLAAGSDGDNYGELTLYKFPQGKNVYGPLQMEKRFSSDTEISREMTLWGQGDSEVIRGNMLTVPVGQSIIYIEPVYITSDKNSFPELKMVIGSYGNKISMKPTLKEVLADLFSNLSEITDLPEVAEAYEYDTGNNDESPSAEIEVSSEIKEAFNELKEASRENDWVKFGEALDELDKLINGDVGVSDSEKKGKLNPFERIFDNDDGEEDDESDEENKKSGVD